jgi:hypothetical protein
MMQDKSENKRFLDTGIHIDEFRDEFLVVCPKCKGMAKVVPEAYSGKLNAQLFSPRKFVCLSCPHRDIWKGQKILTGASVDWYFRLPLWLQISCCNETLWAYNLKHLEIIEQYVSAKLRERTKKGRNSFLSKLPGWIKSAKNRNEILKAIEKLKSKNHGKY